MKTIYIYTSIILIFFVMNSCKGELDSKPVEKIESLIRLSITDKNGKDLLYDKLTIENSIVKSPYSLIAKTGNSEDSITDLIADDNPVRLILMSKIGTFSDMGAGDQGITVYKLNLPTVFGVNHTDTITLYWTLVNVNSNKFNIEPKYDKILINGNEVQLADKQLKNLDYIVE